jgi:O-antigen ligase
VYLFLYLSRILDVTLPNLKITMLLNLIFLGLAVFSGGLAHFFRSRICLLLAGFYCWMVLSLPFSVWKGGSVAALIQAARSLVLMAAIIALVSSVRDGLRVMYVIGLAETTAGLMSKLAGQQSGTERLVLAAGTFADPNIYCALLFMGMPFLWLAARNAAHPLHKLVYMTATLPILAAGLATGSRAGFVMLCAMLGLLFWRLPATRKLRLLVGAGALLAGALLVFPEHILQRYTTLFGAPVPEEASTEQLKYLGAASASTEGRLYLLQRSLELTAKHPIFGVGPGMFTVAEDKDARARGLQRGNWHETHNAYTQVSAEAGLPAFVLYTTALLLALRALGRLRKALTPAAAGEQEHARNGVVYLEVAFAGALTTALFLSIAYTGLLYVLVGLIVALERAVAQEHPGGARGALQSAPLSSSQPAGSHAPTYRH